MRWLDLPGFDEAWIGEHHSAGWEVTSSPELFIAAKQKAKAAAMARPAAGKEAW